MRRKILDVLVPGLLESRSIKMSENSCDVNITKSPQFLKTEIFIRVSVSDLTRHQGTTHNFIFRNTVWLFSAIVMPNFSDIFWYFGNLLESLKNSDILIRDPSQGHSEV